MVKRLEVFTHGQIQDALNILKIMERESLTVADLEKHVEGIVFSPQKKTRRGFMRRTTKEQRRDMARQKGSERRPCVRCNEKRRGKK